MTTVMTHEPSTDKPDRQGVAARLLVPGFWGAVSIIAMWLAVMFDGIFGGDMVFGNNAGGGPTIIPSAVLLGLFAVIGTVSIAKRVFGRRDAGEHLVVAPAHRWARRRGGRTVLHHRDQGRGRGGSLEPARHPVPWPSRPSLPPGPCARCRSPASTCAAR